MAARLWRKVKAVSWKAMMTATHRPAEAAYMSWGMRRGTRVTAYLPRVFPKQPHPLSSNSPKAVIWKLPLQC